MLFFFGWMVLCYCPGFFILAAIFSFVALLSGERLLRLIGMVLIGSSLISASVQMLAYQEAKTRVNETRRKGCAPALITGTEDPE